MTPGEVDLVVVGCVVYDKAPDCDPDEADHMRGGIVWAIDSIADRDTGEVVKAFDVADRWPRGKQRVKFDRLKATDVRQWRPASAASIKSLIASAAEQVFLHGKALGTDELRCVELQRALMAAL